MTTARPPVLVSHHACEQAHDRHPDFFRRRGVDGIYAEVCEALHDGRRAKTMPRWATPLDRSRRSKMKAAPGTGLYVWNEARSRCYALRRGTTRHGPGWIVVTALAPAEETA